MNLKSLIQRVITYTVNDKVMLVAHSQGGLIALQGAWFMSRSVPIDALITLDGALGGAPRLDATIARLKCWGNPAAADMINLWDSATDHDSQGTTAKFLGKDNASVVAALQAARTKVVTIGSSDDCVWNPNKCNFSDKHN